MAKKRMKKTHLRKQNDNERHYEQYFTPLPHVLTTPGGSLIQPSPYLNIWGIQASDAGGEPIFVEP